MKTARYKISIKTMITVKAVAVITMKTHHIIFSPLKLVSRTEAS